MKKIFKYIGYGVLLGTVALVGFEIAHDLATMERGYEAIGGEIFVPFLVLFGRDIWKAMVEPVEN